MVRIDSDVLFAVWNFLSRKLQMEQLHEFKLERSEFQIILGEIQVHIFLLEVVV